ncbi:MAG: NAD-dependent epimerase/dehydratase family protein [Candidatus Hodarchaeales archaeon]|jgi:nucleoside-diphosphate-sugar epimerase
MAILCTGGTGFIGSHLVTHLLEEGEEVICMVRRSSNTKLLEEQGIELRYGDLRGKGLKKAVKGIHTVYHLGAYYTFLGKKADHLEINLEGTKRLFKAAEAAGVDHFIYCSTTEVIGPVLCPGPVDETAPYGPIYFYGHVKQLTEQWLKEQAFSTAWTIIRPSGVYGPRSIEDIGAYLIFDYANKALTSRFGVAGGRGIVHFTHVKDVIQGFSLARQEAAKRETFFICSDNAATVKEVIEIVCDAIGRSPPRLNLPKWLAYAGITPLQVIRWLFRRPKFLVRIQAVRDVTSCRSYSNDKAKRTLGFHPKISLREGLDETIDWYRTNGYL